MGSLTRCAAFVVFIGSDLLYMIQNVINHSTIAVSSAFGNLWIRLLINSTGLNVMHLPLPPASVLTSLQGYAANYSGNMFESDFNGCSDVTLSMHQ